MTANEARTEPNLSIGIQGFEGSNHEIAAWQIHGYGANIVGYEEFAEVFQALRGREVDKGVIALGNTTIRAAFVFEPLYELIDHGKDDFWVTDRTYVDVRHQLLGVPGTDLSQIKSIHSQGVALDQCKAALGLLFPKEQEVELVVEKDTSLSAKKVHEDGDPTQAAIATLRAGVLNNLDVLALDVQDKSNNVTTFFGMSRRDEGMASITGEEDRTLLLLDPGTDDPGVQEYLSREFRLRGINLADWHVDSSPGTDGRVKQFYVEAKAGYTSPRMKKTLRSLGEIARVHVLGTWKEPVKSNTVKRIIV